MRQSSRSDRKHGADKTISDRRSGWRHISSVGEVVQSHADQKQLQGASGPSSLGFDVLSRLRWRRPHDEPGLVSQSQKPSYFRFQRSVRNIHDIVGFENACMHDHISRKVMNTGAVQRTGYRPTDIFACGTPVRCPLQIRLRLQRTHVQQNINARGNVEMLDPLVIAAWQSSQPESSAVRFPETWQSGRKVLISQTNVCHKTKGKIWLSRKCGKNKLKIAAKTTIRDSNFEFHETTLLRGVGWNVLGVQIEWIDGVSFTVYTWVAVEEFVPTPSPCRFSRFSTANSVLKISMDF